MSDFDNIAAEVEKQEVHLTPALIPDRSSRLSLARSLRMSAPTKRVIIHYSKQELIDMAREWNSEIGMGAEMVIDE